MFDVLSVGFMGRWKIGKIHKCTVAVWKNQKLFRKQELKELGYMGRRSVVPKWTVVYGICQM